MASIPAPAALPASPTEVVTTLPAIFTGTVTREHDPNARQKMVEMRISKVFTTKMLAVIGRKVEFLDLQ